MDDQEFINAAMPAMSDATPQPIIIRVLDMWFLVSALQLSLRHPGVGAEQKKLWRHLGAQLQAAIKLVHPEADPALRMGWDEQYDYVPEPPGQAKPTLTPVNNCWTIYKLGGTPDVPALAQIGRPQDWGDPKWMYRVYTLIAQDHINTVHCWVDVAMTEHEHLELFAPLVAQIMKPGYPVQHSTREYLDEDDFWLDEWGKMPEYWEEPDEFDEDDWSAWGAEPYDEDDLGPTEFR